MSSETVNILALPAGEYYDILKKVYIKGKSSLNWKIYVVSQSDYIKPYADFIDSPDQLLLAPPMMLKTHSQGNETEIAQIKLLMAQCEKAVGVPINRILLSNERTFGRAYSKSHYYWAERKIARMALKDNSIGDDILVSMFKFAANTLDRYKPQFVLGAPTNGLINSVFYFVCRHYNIPCIACNTSLVGANRHFFTCDWGSFNTRVDAKFFDYIQRQQTPTSQSLEIVKIFRDKPEPLPHYKTMWLDKSNLLNLRNVNIQIIKRIIHRIVPIIKRQKAVNPKPIFSFIIDFYRTYFLQRSQKKYYRTFAENELSSFNYIYYPFHLDPEIVLNVMAPTWHNQLNTIKMLSYNLPVGYKLLVREHRYNVGRRPSRYLREISRLPGVMLVDGFDNQYKYIKNAQLVVTVNGTSGFEGIMMQRPVLTLDKTFYDKLGHAKQSVNYPDLGKAILDAIASFKVSNDYDEKTALFFDAENAVTLPKDADANAEIEAIQTIIREEWPQQR